MSRLGAERPVSRKLRCRADISASQASESWLSRRRTRQSRSCTPKVLTRASMVGTLVRLPAPFHYLRRKRSGGRGGRAFSLRRERRTERGPRLAALDIGGHAIGLREDLRRAPRKADRGHHQDVG